MICLENLIVFSIVCVILFSIHPSSANEEFENLKRGSGFKTITPVPRRRSDPEFVKWENDFNTIPDNDYGGAEYAANGYIRPHYSFSRMSRAGSQFFPKLSDGSQETIKRGGPGGGAGMWFGPRLGRMQKRSITKGYP